MGQVIPFRPRAQKQTEEERKRAEALQRVLDRVKHWPKGDDK